MGMQGWGNKKILGGDVEGAGKSWEEEFVKPSRQENSVRKSALHVDRNQASERARE